MGMGPEPPAVTNPYAPPKAEIELVPAPGTPAGISATALYSPRQMGWAAFLGGFVLGVLFMRANYRALGNRTAARRTLWLGLVANGGLYAGLLSTRQGLARFAMILASVIFYGFADFMQGRSFHKHLAAGGKRKSHWVVIGWVAVCGVVLFVVTALLAGRVTQDLTGPVGVPRP